jgi:hypothetical protein
MNAFVGIGCGIALIILVDKLYNLFKTERTKSREKVLSEYFGSPIFASTFSLKDVKDWINARSDKIAVGAKVIVLKANDETLKSLGKELNIGSGVAKIIILAVVDEEKKDIIESSLVKYETLDDKLDGSLAKGNGVLVIEM